MATRATTLLAPMVGIVLLAAACAGGSGAASKTPADRGKALFVQTCAACHGPDAKGMVGLGKDLTTSAFVKEQSNPQLVDFINKGRPATDPANTTKVDMLPKGGNLALTDTQLMDIVLYMRTLQR
ncbi:MAG: cytochrome c [Chloroflexi bacterium]|nr:cytochrome c [Chloroflexota bacterium]